MRQIFNPTLFVMHNGILSYNRHTDPAKPAKEADTVARVLIREHFSVLGLPNQIHSDNGPEFVNKLWVELFSELKILHTRIPPNNPSSNIVNDGIER